MCSSDLKKALVWVHRISISSYSGIVKVPAVQSILRFCLLSFCILHSSFSTSPAPRDEIRAFNSTPFLA